MGLSGCRRCEAGNHETLYIGTTLLYDTSRLLQMPGPGAARMCLHKRIFIHANVCVGAADARLPIIVLGHSFGETACRLLPINLPPYVHGIIWPALDASPYASILK